MTTGEVNQALALNVSRETMDRLESLVALVAKWNPAINLISKASVAEMWTRHVVDSAQIYHMAPENFRLWADFGSGGGFPGLVVAAMAREERPTAKFVLVESDQRKVDILARGGAAA